MDSLIWRIILCLNIYSIGCNSYNQGTLLKVLKQLDSKLDEIQNEEKEVNNVKRYQLPPLPDTPLDDIYFKPKWYTRYRHFRPRFGKGPFDKKYVDDKQTFYNENNENDVLKSDISDENKLSYAKTYSDIDPFYRDDQFDSNSINSELYSKEMISPSDNVDFHINKNNNPLDTNVNNAQQISVKELEESLAYISKKVNRMLDEESMKASEGDTDVNSIEALTKETWMEEATEVNSEEHNDLNIPADLFMDQSNLANQSLDSQIQDGLSNVMQSQPVDTETVGSAGDSIVSLLSRLTERLDTLIISQNALPPMSSQEAKFDRALPPLPDDRTLPPLPDRIFKDSLERALPPLPNDRALPPLPYRTLPDSLDRALPPLPNDRALPPLPYRTLPESLDRALPPLPNDRALPPLPYRTLPESLDRALPPLPNDRALPPLPYRILPDSFGNVLQSEPTKMSNEKSQQLVDYINELSEQVDSLTNFLQAEHDMTDKESFSSSPNPTYDHLKERISVLSNEVERLWQNYKSTDYASQENGFYLVPTDLHHKSVDSDTQLDNQEDRLENDLVNLPKIITNEATLGEQSLSSFVPDEEELDDDELSQYVQRVNEEVDQLLQDHGSGNPHFDDQVYNNARSGQDPCQGVAVLKQKEGTIEYPPGHGQYSSFQDCRWAIMGSSPNQQVRIRFTMMAIEHDNPCDDYIQVSQVEEKRIATPKKVYVRLCESSLARVPDNKKEFIVEGPYVLIHFHSDWIWTDRGFGIRYRIEDTKPQPGGKPQPTPVPAPAAPLPEPCKGSGVTVKGDRGIIDFYSGYPDKARCRWFISGGKDTIGVKVTVTDIEIEPSRDCSNDKLTIASVDMKKKTFKSLKEICGSSVPSSSIQVPTNDAYVILTSDSKTHGRGFRLTFEQIRKGTPPAPTPKPQPVTPKPATPKPPTPRPPATPKPPVSPYNDPCQGRGSIIHKNEGTIDFTGGYKSNANCTWFIAADKEAHQIWLTITQLDIKGTGRKCTGDRLVLASILMDQDKVVPVDVICGSRAPADPVIVASRFLYLGFKSDASDTGDGFKLTFSASFPEHPPMTTTLAPGATPRPSTPTPAQPLPLDLQGLSCSFDPGTSCKWGNLKTDKDPLDWKIQTAGSNGWSSYAKTDHTTGSSKGAYAYVFSNQAKAGTKGTLKSPKIKAAPGNGMCLTFWYNMFDTLGRFTVDMVPEGETEETLFVLDGNQGNVWHQAKVALVSDVPFEVYLTHIRGEKPTDTGLAIDDISIINSSCLATPLACGQTKYHSRGRRDIESPSDFERAIDDIGRDVDDIESMLDGRNVTRRVISGETSRHGEWPWIVHLRNFHYGISTGVYSQCGGTLISKRWILSAAHCFEGDNGEVKKDANNVMLYFGEHNIGYGSVEDAQFALKPKKVILHPNRNKKATGSASHRFDFALIELKAPVVLNEFVNVACLPDGPTPVGSKCVAAGWGVSDSGDTSIHLLHIKQQVINRRQCMYKTFEDQVCAISIKGYGDVCQGDSGGPLVCPRKDGKYEVIGAVSFGDKCANKERTPGVYANVHHAMSWIQTTMGNQD